MMIAPYGCSPLFDEITLPASLREEHRTKRGTWGLLRVLEGEVRLIFVDPHEEQLVTVDNPAPIPPESPHYVKLSGRMKMQVEFYRENPHPPKTTIGD